MKSLVGALCVFSFSAMACIGEAQVLGTVKDVTRISMFSCQLTLTSDSQVTVNPLCPLDEGQINSRGISVGLVDGHDCPYTAGDAVSGIVVDNGRVLYFAN